MSNTILFYAEPQLLHDIYYGDRQRTDNYNSSHNKVNEWFEELRRIAYRKGLNFDMDVEILEHTRDYKIYESSITGKMTACAIVPVKFNDKAVMDLRVHRIRMMGSPTVYKYEILIPVEQHWTSKPLTHLIEMDGKKYYPFTQIFADDELINMEPGAQKYDLTQAIKKLSFAYENELLRECFFELASVPDTVEQISQLWHIVPPSDFGDYSFTLTRSRKVFLYRYREAKTSIEADEQILRHFLDQMCLNDNLPHVAAQVTAREMRTSLANINRIHLLRGCPLPDEYYYTSPIKTQKYEL